MGSIAPYFSSLPVFFKQFTDEADIFFSIETGVGLLELG